jgi:hypothetical protein
MARYSQSSGGGGLDTGTLVKYALLAGAGYWVYTHFFSGDSAAGLSVTDLANAIGGGAAPAPASTTPPANTTNPPATSSTTPPAGTTTAQSVADKLVADLKAAVVSDSFFSSQSGKGNANQWNYYRNTLRPPALSPAQFGAAFPDAGDANPPLMTAEEFVAKLTSANVGLGAVIIPLPMRLNIRGVDTVIWASRALRGSNP